MLHDGPDRTQAVRRRLHVVVGDPFAVYAGVSCDLQRVDDGKARAERRLTLTESRAVDLHIAELLDDDAVDLGGPFPVTRRSASPRPSRPPSTAASRPC